MDALFEIFALARLFIIVNIVNIIIAGVTIDVTTAIATIIISSNV